MTVLRRYGRVSETPCFGRLIFHHYWCWRVRGAVPVKISTGNNFPREYQRIPRNYYQYWCQILVTFLASSTVLVIFLGDDVLLEKIHKKFPQTVNYYGDRKLLRRSILVRLGPLGVEGPRNPNLRDLLRTVRTIVKPLWQLPPSEAKNPPTFPEQRT